ncbi:MAG TPA: WYL domain-containing protein [Holophagaceae bacterium]|nr:WYL domain-containing protein [Holophagaceae bacterium]
MPRPSKAPRPDTENLVAVEVLQQVLDRIRDAGPRGIPKAALAEALDKTPRTIDRAIGVLEAQGARFGKERQRVGSGAPVIHFALEKAPSWDSKVTPQARLALEVALLALEGTGSDAWSSPLQSLRELAEQHLSTRDKQLFEQLRDHINVRAAADDAAPLDREVLLRLFTALGDPTGPREIELDYTAANGRQSTRTVVPYTLTHDVFSGGAFLLAWDPKKAEPRHFRLHRIEGLRLTGRAGILTDRKLMARARDYQIGGWVSAEAPFEVAVRVTGEGWPAFLRETPPALPEVLVEARKGQPGVMLRFKATEFNAPTRYILQFGADAQVQSPADLKAHVRSVLAAALARY